MKSEKRNKKEKRKKEKKRKIPIFQIGINNAF